MSQNDKSNTEYHGALAIQELAGPQQRPNQPTADFEHAFMQSWNKLLEQQTHIFIATLTPHIRDAILRRPQLPSTISDVVSLARRIEWSREHGGDEQPPYRRGARVRHAKWRIDHDEICRELYAAMPRWKEVRARRTREGRCFNCNKRGHKAQKRPEIGILSNQLGRLRLSSGEMRVVSKS